ncbi:MAG: hypothetical protein ACI4A5_10915 [Hominilimicola sp.]
MKRFVKSIVAVATIISIVLSLMPAALASSVMREDDKTVVQLDSGEVRIIYDDGGLTVVDKNGRTKIYENSLAMVHSVRKRALQERKPRR